MAQGAFLLTLAFVGVQFFTNFWFLIHNIGSRYARKPIKGSKDSDDILVSKKTLSQKIVSMVWRPGSGKIGYKNEKNTPHLWWPPQRTPNPKWKIFFQF